LQYANTDGEGLGDLVMCGFVRQTEGRHMEGGAWWKNLKLLFLLSVQRLEAGGLAWQCQYCSQFMALRTVQHKTEIIIVGHLSTLCLVSTWC